MNNIEELLFTWKSSDFSKNIVKWEVINPTPPSLVSFPDGINRGLKESLQRQGIQNLYSHQLECWNHLELGRNVMVSTSTASGKTLCYNLTVLNSILLNKATKALYIFPTKALAADQLKKLHAIIAEIDPKYEYEVFNRITPAIYDGDTSVNQRNQIRLLANILLTNPDMLHMAILPHHTLWEKLFQDLKYIVIDEIHIYRGVFGSHLTNLLRRLKRILQFYGSNAQFIMTSATIANPIEFAEKLIEEPVTLVNKDGSPNGKRNFILYNPPIIDNELGLRSGIISETTKLAGDLLDKGIQSIFFARSRKTVEITLRNLQTRYENQSMQVNGYRSGYLPEIRRRIENELRNGTIRAVVSTNALELGIDLGSMDAIVMMGFPGSIAAFRQQAGRAGRKQGSSLALLIASSNPLDQFIMQHPEFLLEQSPENALINPNNPLILLAHLKCAAFELPFYEQRSFGNLNWDSIKQYFDFLEIDKSVVKKGERYFWMTNLYPSNQISIRGGSAQTILLQCHDENGNKTIGEVDFESACWMVHPGAIYLQEGNSYLVKNLDFDLHLAEMTAFESDYFTEPKKNIEIQKIKTIKESGCHGYSKFLGEILVKTQVTGFSKIMWESKQVLSVENLNLPPTEFRTMAFWISLDEQLIDNLRKNTLWLNDPNQYGSDWVSVRDSIRKRDFYTCQLCGKLETTIQHHVHHKIPFRAFSNPAHANQFDNLITLCANCHKQVEQNVRIRSGLSGLSYSLLQLAPLILMCAEKDLGTYYDPQAKITDNKPAIVIYDQFPGGIGLSDSLYEHDIDLIRNARQLVNQCKCSDGCPSCVGPAGENGMGAKKATSAIFALLLPPN